MASTAYLRLKGQKTGPIKGGVTQKGREDMIAVIAVNHSIDSPRDPASGLATGKRQHHPFVITKELDRSSPVLYQVLVTNENLTQFDLLFWQPAASGAEQQTYTIKLSNAHIVSIHFVMPNTRDPDTARFNPFEEIAFTYEKIQWTWNDGGITAEDDWEARA
jgi:type VI secretion system secreted protein Hcp